jgi:Family of unknown function (DUF6084)
MPDLNFQIEGVETQQFAAAPTLIFKLRVNNATPHEAIHTIALRCQIQLEVSRRKYNPEDQNRLRDLFGQPERWGETLRNMLWTHASVVAPAFENDTLVDLPVPCTFDFNLAATKYFHGVTDGEIPLNFLFSGTIFYAGQEGGLQVAPIPWSKEARYRLQVKTWQEMMEIYYPNSAWLCLRKDIFERLYAFKVDNAIPTWEQALERLLASEEVLKP